MIAPAWGAKKGESAMSVPGIGPRFRSPRVRAIAIGCVVLGELAIALPFLVVSPSTVRGVPGPLLVLLGVAGAFIMGPRIGAFLAAVGALLAVTILGENAYTEPVVWVSVAIGVGIVGDRVRRGDDLRRALLQELSRGLVTVMREPQVGSYRIVSRYVPAERAQVLAGDFYGVIREPNGALAVMVGDVAGHGPGAAAVATRLRASWRGLASAGVPACDAVQVLNETLIAERRRTALPVLFATLCLATVEDDGSSASFVLAGHPSPLLVTRGGVDEYELPTDPAIGITEHPQWREHEVKLPAAPWSLLFYTDGLVEGRTSPAGPRPFGTDRLRSLLAAPGPPLGEEDVDTVLETVAAANGGPMGDDIVIVAVSPLERSTGLGQG
jgi:Stage II sporulation protein E (SpoIIE)